MGTIQDEIAAFERLQTNLETEHRGEWVLMCNQQVIGFFQTFDTTAAEAIRRFGLGPYLIREIGAPPLRLPASVMYHRDVRR